MKKLALALVCLIGVAFLSSCDPKNVIENPEPNIEFLKGDTYVADGDVLDYFGVYNFGVRAASNPETLEPLARLVITSKSEDEVTPLLDTLISGTEFIFEDVVYFAEDSKEIIGSFVITAEVTDAAGEKKAISMECEVDLEEELTPYDFTWNRHGGEPATGLDGFGLKWGKNLKDDVYAVIEPLEGALLYRLDSKVWEETQTEAQLAALLSEATPVDQFREVSCYTPDKDYDIVIATTYEEINYLIHITHSHSEPFKGTDVTITGQYK